MEDGGSLFVPDFLTPSQWCDLHRSVNGDDAPIKRLMLALLEISLRDATGARRAKLPPQRRRTFVRPPSTRACERVERAKGARALRREAIDWIFDESADGLPFSFASVCDTLDIDVEALRERVRGRSADKRAASLRRPAKQAA